MESLKKLENFLNYSFQDKALLKQALTHRSFDGHVNNERLEFLGDAALSLIITEALFQAYPKIREGELSHMRSVLVRGERLTELAKTLLLSHYLKLGVGERKQSSEVRHSILANALEALIGALCLDAGIEKCREIVLQLYGEDIIQLSQIKLEKDAKSALQEWLQSKKMPLPKYEVNITGESHAQTFEVICRVKGLSHETNGISTSRRRAEQVAAKNFLEFLHEKS